jgi:dTDP-4-dehydrorhamnose 3,5-epimerase-like enzyme
MLNDSYKVTPDASIHKFEAFEDDRGTLHVKDFSNFPVSFIRLFVIEGSKAGDIRGSHAHKECWLFAYASGAGITLNIKNTCGSKTFALDQSFGVLIPPYNWTEVLFEIKSAKLNILASHPYDANDYISTIP